MNDRAFLTRVLEDDTVMFDYAALVLCLTEESDSGTSNVVTFPAAGILLDSMIGETS